MGWRWERTRSKKVQKKREGIGTRGAIAPFFPLRYMIPVIPESPSSRSSRGGSLLETACNARAGFYTYLRKEFIVLPSLSLLAAFSLSSSLRCLCTFSSFLQTRPSQAWTGKNDRTRETKQKRKKKGRRKKGSGVTAVPPRAAICDPRGRALFV